MGISDSNGHSKIRFLHSNCNSGRSRIKLAHSNISNGRNRISNSDSNGIFPDTIMYLRKGIPLP